jgi:hypothetical protein
MTTINTTNFLCAGTCNIKTKRAETSPLRSQQLTNIGFIFMTQKVIPAEELIISTSKKWRAGKAKLQE